MSNFVNLNETLLSMQIDPATAKQPIKRMFVADGDFLSANVSILTDTENALHTQPNHDEIVLVLEGEVAIVAGGKEVGRVGQNFSFGEMGPMLSYFAVLRVHWRSINEKYWKLRESMRRRVPRPRP